jgi:hypothetical protein
MTILAASMNNRFKNLFFWLSGAGTDTLES